MTTANWIEAGISALGMLVFVCSILDKLQRNGALDMPQWLAATVTVIAANPFPFLRPKDKPPARPPNILVLAPLLLVLGCGPRPPVIKNCPPPPKTNKPIPVAHGVIELAYGTSCYQRGLFVWCEDEVAK